MISLNFLRLNNMTLEILGIVVQVPFDVRCLGLTQPAAAQVEKDGVSMFPSQAKIDKWTARIDAALQSGKLHPGEAKKLGGGLTWAGQRAFKRLGRAMLRPILHQEK